jgi:hypothetical protein
MFHAPPDVEPKAEKLNESWLVEIWNSDLMRMPTNPGGTPHHLTDVSNFRYSDDR